MKIAPRRPAARRSCAAAACVVAFALSGCAISPAPAPRSLAESSATPAPVYVAEPGFPQPSGVRFDTVSWVERDPRTGFLHAAM